MSLSNGNYAILWCCIDCVLARENGDEQDPPPDREPWSELEPGDWPNLSLGLLFEDHRAPAECEALRGAGDALRLRASRLLLAHLRRMRLHARGRALGLLPRPGLTPCVGPQCNCDSRVGRQPLGDIMATATITATETDSVLADMLTENTGRHMLDSGGAYGRSWERNQGKAVETFLAEDAVTIHANFGYVTLSVFHWLRDRLEFDAEKDAIFRRWVDVFDPDSYWLESMEAFAEAAQGGPLSHGYLYKTTNSYNHKNSLSQTIQFTMFQAGRRDGAWSDGETYVLLQIHGGCDVRGGYTVPRVFRVTSGEAADMFDFDAYTLGCTAERDMTDPLPGMPYAEPHYLDCRNGEWIEYGGRFSPNPWEERGVEQFYDPEDDDAKPFIRCPFCVEPTPMEAYPYPVS